jgi:arabinogalactan endo-1,4-beta-galactosidase
VTGATPGHGRAWPPHRHLGLRAATAPLAILVALVAAFATPAAAEQRGAPNAQHPGSRVVAQVQGNDVPTINWALTGTATAQSSQPGSPPANAIDGDAATSWCTNTWPDTLTVDLGQVHELSGFGVTLENSSSSARAAISVATQPGDWQQVAGAQSLALDPGNPMYIPISGAGPRGHGFPGRDNGFGGNGFGGNGFGGNGFGGNGFGGNGFGGNGFGGNGFGGQGYANSGATVPVRYAQLTIWDSGAAPVCVGEFRLFGPDPAAAHMMLGADMSFTAQELAAGNTFSDNGVTANPIDILANHGANVVRLRLWVNPPSGYSSLQTDLALARTVKRAGLKLYLDIMYSDFWADPGKQCIPAGWPDTFPALTQKVESYTQQVVSAFAAQGTPVDIVSVGNEVTNGMLWSYDKAPAGDWPNFGCTGTPGQGGYLDWTGNTSATGWGNFTQLLKAGIAGAQAGNPPGHRLLVAIHTDLGGGETPYGANDTEKSQYFYQQLQKYGVPFDIVALSYYPLYQGSLSGMRATVDNLATTVGKPIVLAETEYAWTLANGDALGNDTWQSSQLIDGYPASPGGQISFVNDEMSILAAAPNGLGAGVLWWEPEWIPGVNWAPNASPAGTPDDNMTLFDFQGRALPSVAIFQNPVSTCASYDPYQVPCVTP